MDYSASHCLLFGKIIFLLSLYRSTQAAKCEANITVSGQPYVPFPNVTQLLLPYWNSACRDNFNKSAAGQPFSTPKDVYFQVQPVRGDDGVITKVWWSDGGHPCFHYTACNNDCLQMSSIEGTMFVCRKCDPLHKNIQYFSVSRGSFSTILMYNDSSCSSVTNFLSTSYKRYNTNMTSDYFCCKSDNLCIWKGLRCDNDSNCIDGSDEIGCPGAIITPALPSFKRSFMIVVLVLFSGFCILCIVAVVAYLRMNARRRQRESLIQPGVINYGDPIYAAPPSVFSKKP